MMDWLPLSAEAGQRVRIEVWTGTEEKLLRKLRVSGPVGSFDQADTVREILLTNIQWGSEHPTARRIHRRDRRLIHRRRSRGQRCKSPPGGWESRPAVSGRWWAWWRAARSSRRWTRRWW